MESCIGRGSAFDAESQFMLPSASLALRGALPSDYDNTTSARKVGQHPRQVARGKNILALISF